MGEHGRGRRGSSTWLRLAGDPEDVEHGDATCPCGGVPVGATLDECCGPLVRGEVPATTAEQQMRSRYTAHTVAASDHLFRTWHPRIRPTSVEPDPWVTWVRLEVLAVHGGGEDDVQGVVEYRARWTAGEGVTPQRGELHGRSCFVRHAGRWAYVGSPEDLPALPPLEASPVEQVPGSAGPTSLTPRDPLGDVVRRPRAQGTSSRRVEPV